MLFQNFTKKGIRVLQMKLRNQLKVGGLVADVYTWIQNDDAYKNPDPDEDDEQYDPITASHRVINTNYDGHYGPTPARTTKVFLKTHVGGLDIGPNGVSTSDKLQTEYTVIALDKFAHRDKLSIHMPDGETKNMDLVIVEELANNGYMQVGYAYTGRVI